LFGREPNKLTHSVQNAHKLSFGFPQNGTCARPLASMHGFSFGAIAKIGICAGMS